MSSSGWVNFPVPQAAISKSFYLLCDCFSAQIYGFFLASTTFLSTLYIYWLCSCFLSPRRLFHFCFYTCRLFFAHINFFSHFFFVFSHSHSLFFFRFVRLFSLMSIVFYSPRSFLCRYHSASLSLFCWHCS